MNSRRIAVIIEGRVSYEREVLLGIRDFATQEPGWIIRLEMPGRQVKRFLGDWQPDGVLFQAAGLPAEGLRAVNALRCPAIHVSDSRQTVTAPCVGLDNQLIGQLAASYFLERGYEQLAYVGVRGMGFSLRRLAAFQETIKRSPGTLRSFELPAGTSNLEVKVERKLREWLRALPKPTALFAVHDHCSLLIATLAREEGIRVPEDLAILGSDDDSLMCELAWPKLSSIAVPARRVGWVAAELLNQYLGSSPVGPRSRAAHSSKATASTLLPPLEVVTRQSTDVNQTDDETVNRVLRHIADHFQERINIDDILRDVGLSRRALERKFRQCLGRSPLQELHRRRVEYARYLLAHGKQPLHRIAERAGFADASQFVNVFRKQTGITPGVFRKQLGG